MGWWPPTYRYNIGLHNLSGTITGRFCPCRFPPLPSNRRLCTILSEPNRFPKSLPNMKAPPWRLETRPMGVDHAPIAGTADVTAGA